MPSLPKVVPFSAKRLTDAAASVMMSTGALADGTRMDSTYPPEAWKRLGKVLEARRGQLGYGFRQRERFLADRGGPPPSVKMLARLERGERTSYPPATVTLLESLYGYAPGSFDAVLAGGEPAPLPAAPGPPLLRALAAVPRSREEELLAWYVSYYSHDGTVRVLAEQQPGRPVALLLADVLMYVTVKYGSAASPPETGDGRANGAAGR